VLGRESEAPLHPHRFLRAQQRDWPGLTNAEYRGLVRAEAHGMNSPPVTDEQLEAFFTDSKI